MSKKKKECGQGAVKKVMENLSDCDEIGIFSNRCAL